VRGLKQLRQKMILVTKRISVHYKRFGVTVCVKRHQNSTYTEFYTFGSF
jgi:predicted nucleic-acid-binding Zn-ribbon protein